MEKYRCHECGSDNILVRAWIDPKKDIIDSWDEDECFCKHCLKITTYDITNN